MYSNRMIHLALPRRGASQEWLNKPTQKMLRSIRRSCQVASVSRFLLLASAFHRKFNALPAFAVEFKVLSSRLVKAVAAGLAQRRPLKCFRSLVLNYHRILRVCATANRRNPNLSNLAHCG